MSSINNIGQIISLLRREMTEPVTGTGPAGNRAALSNSAGAPGGAPAENTPLALALKRIKGIDKDDPERGRKAFRMFLEAVLLKELGDSLINDPNFYNMVAHIQATMENEPQLAQAIDKAIEHLLAGEGA